jgi:hypothetical protein
VHAHSEERGRLTPDTLRESGSGTLARNKTSAQQHTFSICLSVSSTVRVTLVAFVCPRDTRCLSAFLLAAFSLSPVEHHGRQGLSALKLFSRLLSYTRHNIRASSLVFRHTYAPKRTQTVPSKQAVHTDTTIMRVLTTVCIDMHNRASDSVRCDKCDWSEGF